MSDRQNDPLRKWHADTIMTIQIWTTCSITALRVFISLSDVTSSWLLTSRRQQVKTIRDTYIFNACIINLKATSFLITHVCFSGSPQVTSFTTTVIHHPHQSTMADNFWDNFADEYTRSCTPFCVLHAFDLLTAILPSISPNPQCNILDVGCGGAALALAYLRHFPQGVEGHTFTCTDLSPVMVSLARAAVERVKPETCKTVFQFRVDNGTTLETVQDNSVDVVVSAFAVFLIPDRTQVLNQINRVLRDGGVFGMTAWTQIPDLPVSSYTPLLFYIFQYIVACPTIMFFFCPTQTNLLFHITPNSLDSDSISRKSYLAVQSSSNLRRPLRRRTHLNPDKVVHQRPGEMPKTVKKYWPMPTFKRYARGKQCIRRLFVIWWISGVFTWAVRRRNAPGWAKRILTGHSNHSGQRWSQSPVWKKVMRIKNTWYS